MINSKTDRRAWLHRANETNDDDIDSIKLDEIQLWGFGGDSECERLVSFNLHGEDGRTINVYLDARNVADIVAALGGADE